VHIKVRVSVETKKDEVAELAPDTLIVSVRAKPERNQANRRVIELVAEHLGVAVGQIRIIHGHHNPAKILEIRSQT
jgi:uncharacterized protein YggU (UPF0235/DUF167 family)